jgi:hypothetical protein
MGVGWLGKVVGRRFRLYTFIRIESTPYTAQLNLCAESTPSSPLPLRRCATYFCLARRFLEDGQISIYLNQSNLPVHFVNNMFSNGQVLAVHVVNFFSRYRCFFYSCGRDGSLVGALRPDAGRRGFMI